MGRRASRTAGIPDTVSVCLVDSPILRAEHSPDMSFFFQAMPVLCQVVGDYPHEAARL